MSSKKYIPSPGGMLPNGTVYEQIQIGETVQYAMKTTKGIDIKPFINVGEHIIYQPFTPCPWMLPGKPIPYESVEELWQEIKDFVYEHVDIEKQELYDVFVGWILETWIPEKFDATGYLHFNGPRNCLGVNQELPVFNDVGLEKTKIGELEPDTYVDILSYDFNENMIVQTKAYVMHTETDLYKITVSDENNNKKYLIASKEHRFFRPDGSEIAVENLSKGDYLARVSMNQSALRSLRLRSQWVNPSFRENRIKTMTGAPRKPPHLSPQETERRRNRMISLNDSYGGNVMNDPKIREKMAHTLKKLWQNEEYRKEHLPYSLNALKKVHELGGPINILKTKYPEKYEEWRKKRSQIMKGKFAGKNNPSYGISRYPKLRHVPELGHFVRSSWEEEFCSMLKKANIPYLYEPITLPVTEKDGRKHTYTPDIKCNEYFVEIKGPLYDWQEEKIDAFLKQYQDIKLIMIHGRQKPHIIDSPRFTTIPWNEREKALQILADPPICKAEVKHLKIVKIELIGRRKAVDLRVPIYDNFILSNGIISHNSGKTRALDVLNYLCFRALESPTASGAALFRAIDAFHPTFLLDEFEMYAKQIESKAEVIGIINSGYRRGQVALRIIGMKEGMPQIKGFRLFSPKALSSIEALPPALDSRCIRFPMRKTFRKIRRQIDKKKALELRSKLLYWRFSHDLDEPFDDEGNPIDLPDGRLIEMFYPIEVVAPTQEIKDTILQCARDQYNVSIEEDRATKEAEIFNAIIDMLEEEPRLRIPQRDIRVKYNASKADSEKLSNQRVTGLLKTLNFKKVWNSEKRWTEIAVQHLHLESRKNIYVIADELERVNRVISNIRWLSATDQEKQENQQTMEGFSEGKALVSEEKPPDSQKTIDSIESIDSIGNGSLQDKLEYVYSILTTGEDLMSVSEISEKIGLPVSEVDRFLATLAREDRAFSPRIGLWKASRM